MDRISTTNENDRGLAAKVEHALTTITRRTHTQSLL